MRQRSAAEHRHLAFLDDSVQMGALTGPGCLPGHSENWFDAWRVKRFWAGAAVDVFKPLMQVASVFLQADSIVVLAVTNPDLLLLRRCTIGYCVPRTPRRTPARRRVGG
jgi:hypothetical protein